MVRIVTGRFEQESTTTTTTWREDIPITQPSLFLGCYIQNLDGSGEAFLFIEMARGGARWDRHVLVPRKTYVEDEMVAYVGDPIEVAPPNQLILYSQNHTTGDRIRWSASWSVTL